MAVALGAAQPAFADEAVERTVGHDAAVALAVPASGAFRNAARMNVLLELVRIRYNRAATEADFAAELRDKLADGAAPKRLLHDPRMPGRRVSSSSLRAWLPQQPARHKPRFSGKKSAGPARPSVAKSRSSQPMAGRVTSPTSRASTVPSSASQTSR
jgi:hypothetical protein